MTKDFGENFKSQKQPLEVFCKKGVLTGKRLCQKVFFNKIAGLRHFPVNFAKFLRTPFL